MGVGIRLKGLLRERDMTIKELAEETGVSVNTLYSITKRDSVRVDFDTLIKIASALNVDVSELTGPGMVANSIVADFDSKLVERAAAQLAESMTTRSVTSEELRRDRELLERITACFERLNQEGIKKAVERMEELTEIPRYQKPGGERK